MNQTDKKRGKCNTGQESGKEIWQFSYCHSTVGDTKRICHGIDRRKWSREDDASQHTIWHSVGF